MSRSIRNLPLLLQLLFWYNAVLKALPDVRDSIDVPGGIFLNNRGLFSAAVRSSDAASCASLIALRARRDRRASASASWAQQAAGADRPAVRRSCLVALGLIVGLPLAGRSRRGHAGRRSSIPRRGASTSAAASKSCRNSPRCCSASSIYTAAFIAEVVRAGILAVSHGQTEAADALGLRSGPTLRLVVIPQAMRVIIPPLTSQYLNLTKNSSLAVAIGYPDLVQIFTGTVLNQTGQAVEVVVITMAVYLTISLVTSLAMNWYNARMALVER